MLPKFRSFVHPIVWSFVRSFMVRSSVRPIIRSFVRSFVQIIFFLPLCCQNSDRSFVQSFDRSWFVCPIVRPNNHFPAIMLPKFRSFVRSIIRSFIVRSEFLFIAHRSFIRTIHHHYFTVTIYRHYLQSLFYHYYLPSLFTVTIYRHYLPLLFTVTILPLLFTVTILPLLFTVTIYRHYLPLLFTITIHRYYSSISQWPQISTTHPSCYLVHLRPARPIFQLYKLRWLWFSFQWELPIWWPILGFSKLSTLNLRFLWTRLPNSDSNNSHF
jgi:hypothetical protein